MSSRATFVPSKLNVTSLSVTLGPMVILYPLVLPEKTRVPLLVKVPPVLLKVLFTVRVEPPHAKMPQDWLKVSVIVRAAFKVTVPPYESCI